MHSRASSSRHVVVEVQRDSAGKPRAFGLSFERERVVLDPVTSWAKTDTFKWVTRGVIEQPQSFHVHPDGTVEINGEKLSPHDAEGAAKLEHEINKHHEAAATPKPAADLGLRKAAAQAHPSDRVTFHVKLDHFGHVQIECFAGEERTGTGLRGLVSLMQNGLMLKPAQFHMDPMQRHVEIDGVRFECNEAGVQQLETALNARYAPKLKDSSETPVEIRDNPASPSGFDIRFVTIHAGARFEIKGHLSQEKLDLLQDPSKCNLLKPGILFRLVPPLLLVRRRRPDGGEEPMPELADLPYLRSTSVELQQFLNHPLVRRGATAGPAATGTSAEEKPDVVALRVRRNPQNKLVLWLELVTREGQVTEGRALTHHNLAELQHAGKFLPHLDVALSLDGRTLSVLDQNTGQEQQLALDPNGSEEDLLRAGQMLTAALRPSPPRPPRAAADGPAIPAPPPPAGLAPMVEASPVLPEPATASVPPPPVTRVPPAPPVTEQPPAVTEVQPPGAGLAAPAPDKARDEPESLAALGFPVADPLETVLQVFRTLAADAGLPVQDVLLSLPMAFTDRRFEILSFAGQPIEGVLELRSEDFAGFYLTHVHSDHVLLVYANRGRHLEFGPRRCELQAGVAAEPDEFQGAGLLGLAQDAEGNFVFIVTREYRAWAGSRERAYLEAAARFLTPGEVAAARETMVLIWPVDWL